MTSSTWLDEDRRRTIGQVLLYIALFITGVARLAYDVRGYIDLIALVFLLAKMIGFQRYTPRQALFCLAVSVFAVANAYLSQSMDFPILCFICMATQDANLRSIARYGCVVMALALCVQTFLCWGGWLSWDVYVASENKTYFSLGFANPNGFGAEILALAMTWLGWRWERCKKIAPLVLLALAIFILLVPKSRASALVLILAAVLVALSLRFERFLCYALPWVIPTAAVVILLLTFFYHNVDFVKNVLNSILTNRMYWGDLYYRVYGITLLGQPVEVFSFATGTMEYAPFDTTVQVLFIQNGVIAGILYIAISTAAALRLGKVVQIKEWMDTEEGITSVNLNCNTGMLIAMAVFAAYATMELYVLFPLFNFTLLTTVLLWGPRGVTLAQAVGRLTRRAGTEG